LGNCGRAVLVTGGAGYVGAELCPRLIEAGYRVRVLDTCWYGSEVFGHLLDHPRFDLHIGDIRDPEAVKKSVTGATDVIHLACISNDPSYDLDPRLGEEVNFLSFEPLVNQAKAQGVQRFIYASSSSVYGVKEEQEVTEDLSLEPLTDYSHFKARCEPIVLGKASGDFITTVVRPATVCGYSRRQRMDLVVNILVNHAVNRGVIKVFGGDQYRPNLHISDMCSAYIRLLDEDPHKVQEQVFNIGGTNHTVMNLAEIVSESVGGALQIEVESTNDNRSYRISSRRIDQTIGFRPERTVGDAAYDLVTALRSGLLPNSMTDSRYFNIERMNEILAAQ